MTKSAAFPDPDETLEISVTDLDQLLSSRCGDSGASAPAGEEGRFPLLVDCREDDEWEICRIEGARLLPLSRFPDAAEPLLQGAGDQPVVVYCHHGMRSAQVAGYLRRRGLSRVWSLAGGIDAWSRSIDPAVPRY